MQRTLSKANASESIDLGGRRLLIFIVAYNAAKTLGSVLSRIPASLRQPGVEVLVIDDASQDGTFRSGVEMAERASGGLRITTLRTPSNQGYGGNQKLGYQYAIDQDFDFVALVHGDGQYAPEKLPELLQPLLQGEAEAVFGSRMLRPRDALAGGMPRYKWLGNRLLTAAQNWLLGTNLSEFHTGYRLYSVDALKKIPFSRNSNAFHFDTEIIIQFVLGGRRIAERPIPTYYGDEICHVNGLAYAWQVMRATLRSQFHVRNLLFDGKYDVRPAGEKYDLKLGYPSSHTMALDAVREGARVLDLGCGRGLVAAEMARKAAQVTGIDQFAHRNETTPKVRFHRANLDHLELPVQVSSFDQIFLLDIIEHLREPERFVEYLRSAAESHRPEIILTTGNVGFVVTRLMLMFGHFNYGERGILDRTHTRLFTFGSLRNLLAQGGYDVLEMRGIPAPFPKAIGFNWLSRLLILLNRWLIRVSRGLFAYQIFVRARLQPTVATVLRDTIDGSAQLRDHLLASASR